MQVKAKKTEYVTVDVDDNELADTFEQWIRDRANLGRNQWINKDGVLMEEVDTPHGGYDQKVGDGTATEMQRFGYKMINDLQNIRYWRISK